MYELRRRRYNIQYSYDHRPYSLDGSDSINFKKFGFVASHHGLRAGEEIILHCDFTSLTSTNVPPTNESPDKIIGRDLSWLKEYGICIDNVAVRDSSIVKNEPHRGAFAKRNMPVGSVISVSPVIHMDFSQLEIVHQQPFVNTTSKGIAKNPLSRIHGIEYNNSLVLGKQLLTNYVFGHIDSNMILFPMAPGVNFINHYKVMDLALNSTSNANHQKPNVGIRWTEYYSSEEEKARLKDLLEVTPIMQLYEEKAGTFALEYYALEHIKTGEELLLDYGPDWERAYIEHQDLGTREKPFRHVIGVPTDLVPQHWMRADPIPDGDSSQVP
jgi:hypothetical protein